MASIEEVLIKFEVKSDKLDADIKRLIDYGRMTESVFVKLGKAVEHVFKSFEGQRMVEWVKSLTGSTAQAEAGIAGLGNAFAESQREAAKLAADLKETLGRIVQQLHNLGGDLEKSFALPSGGARKNFSDLDAIIKKLTSGMDQLGKASAQSMGKTAGGAMGVLDAVGKVIGIVDTLQKVYKAGAALGSAGGPIALGAVAVAATFAEFEKWKQENNAAYEKIYQNAKNNVDVTGKLCVVYQELSSRTRLTREEKENLAKVQARLVQLLPEAVVGYDKEGKAILDMEKGTKKLAELKTATARQERNHINDELRGIEEKKKKLQEEVKNQNQVLKGNQAFLKSRDNIPDKRRKENQDSSDATRIVQHSTKTELAQLEARERILKQKRTEINKLLKDPSPQGIMQNFQQQIEAERKLAQEAERRQRAQQAAAIRAQAEKSMSERIYALTHSETEMRMRELDKQKAAYEKAGVRRVTVEGKTYSVMQWYELERTRIFEEQTKKRQAIEEEYRIKVEELSMSAEEKEIKSLKRQCDEEIKKAKEVGASTENIEKYYKAEISKVQAGYAKDREKFMADWQQKVKSLNQTELQNQIDANNATRQEQLEAAKQKFKDAKELKEAESEINTYYDTMNSKATDQHNREIKAKDAQLQADLLESMGKFEEAALAREQARREAELAQESLTDDQKTTIRKISEQNIANIQKEYSEKRLAEQEEAIQKEFSLERELTLLEKEELIKRMENEQIAARQENKTERAEALGKSIEKLKGDVKTARNEIAKQWADLIKGLVKGTTTWKDLWKQSLDKMLDDFIMMLVQMMMKSKFFGGIMSVIGQFFGISGFSTGTSGGYTDTWANTNFGSVPYPNPEIPFDGPTVYAARGMITPNVGGDIPAYLHKNEAVLPEYLTTYLVGAAKKGGGAEKIQVNIVNQTGVQAEGRAGKVEFDGERYVTNVMLKAVANNTSGIRDVLKGMR